MNILTKTTRLGALILAGLATAIASNAQTPIISVQPASQTNVAGTTATFTVTATGTGPLSYQWQLNGTNLTSGLPGVLSTMTTVAGNGTSGYSGDGGNATNASINAAYGVAMDAAGNLFIADSSNNRIRKVDTNGIVTTFAGNGAAGYSGDGGLATNASLSFPLELVFDAFGNLLFTDNSNNRIRKVGTNGIITTVAGGGSSGDGGAATNASFNNPVGLALDAAGNLFVADVFNQRIRKINTSGIITTVAGNGSMGYSGDGGAATNASLRYAMGIGLDGSGNLFITDTSNYRVRKVSTNGIITTVAGKGTASYSGDGGAATNAGVNQTRKVVFDAAGNMLIADFGNNRIRKVDKNGIITTIAGNGSAGYSGDGAAATNASLNSPISLALDAAGNLFISDYGNHRIRKVASVPNPNLTIPNVNATNAGNYTVIVGNSFGSVTSLVATLTVVFPPLITAQPASQTNAAGTTATFSVTASGTPPLSYQWSFNSTNISGATNATLTLTNVQLASAGNYSVQVTNNYGSVLSSNATLTVNLAPVIPVITSFSPPAGVVGAVVNIGGLNFDPVPANNVVYFGAVRAVVTTASATNLVMTVPAGATFGPITETVNGLTAYAAQPFMPTFPGVGQISSASLATRLDLAAGTSPGSVVLADLDGDGKPDLLWIEGASAEQVSICRNISTNGSLTAGSFAPRVVVPLVSGANPDMLVAADVDGDGRLDIIAISGDTSVVSILRNIGSPGNLTTNSFGARVDLQGGNTMRGLAVRDLNGDGRPEIVTANYGNNNISIYQNLSAIGSIAFAPKVDFATGTGPTGVAIGDLEGDGRPDLAVANYSSATISVFRNLGAGINISTNSFAPKVDFSVPATPQPIVMGDLDGDGKLDLVVGSESSGQKISVFRNTATAGSLTTSSFAARVDFAAAGWVNTLALADLDGDGKLDVVLGSQISSLCSVFKNVSVPGSFTTASLASRVDFSAGGSGANPNGISIGDLDGDGRPDIVFCNSYLNTVSIYRNLVATGVPPTITSQPTNQTVAVGGTATFNVTANGAGLNYQWRFNGTNILWATNANYYIPSATTNHSGIYAVVVSNDGGSVTSSNAVLTVNPPPRNSSGTAILTGNFVTSVNITDGGSGYTNAPLVRFIGGGGSGAGGFAVISNGVVISITVTNAGFGYTNAPVVVIDPPFILNPVLGISPYSFLAFSNLTVGGNYQLQKAMLWYWTNQPVNFTATNSIYTQMVAGVSENYRLALSPVPAQAFATAQAVNGFVVGVTITSGGSGYVTSPAVSIIDGGGYGAGAYAGISGGVVTSITVTNAGFGYAATPTVRIAAPPAAAVPPTVSMVMRLDSASLAAYNNYQIQFKPLIGGAWVNWNGGLFTPTALTNSQYVFITNDIGFFRLQYVP